jgi:hypothetical protein
MGRMATPGSRFGQADAGFSAVSVVVE